jgi:proline iminopeptidase
MRVFPSSALLLPATLAACLSASDLVPPTVDDDPSLPSLQLNGTSLHISEFGNPGDPLIVFVHGGPGGDHRQFLLWAGLADAGYHLVMYDQRGAGLSRRHSRSEIGVEIALDDLQAVIDHYRAASQPLVLFSHSWGSMMTTAFINRDPSRVQGAILVEPPGFTRDQVEEFFLGTFDRLDFGEGVEDIIWSSQFVSPDQHAEWDYMALVAQRDGGGNAGGDYDNAPPFWRWGAAMSYYLPQSIGEFDWTTRLQECTYPVLWFTGARNRGTSEREQRELAASYPSFELHVVPDAGHDLLYQRQQQLQPIVLDYLARVTGRQIP